jgi:hypothetical protein
MNSYSKIRGKSAHTIIVDEFGTTNPCGEIQMTEPREFRIIDPNPDFWIIPIGTPAVAYNLEKDIYVIVTTSKEHKFEYVKSTNDTIRVVNGMVPRVFEDNVELNKYFPNYWGIENRRMVFHKEGWYLIVSNTNLK